MLQRVRDVVEWLSPFHAQFGVVRGTRVGGAVRQLSGEYHLLSRP
jgi:hypothetical protein